MKTYFLPRKANSECNLKMKLKGSTDIDRASKLDRKQSSDN